jgi:hypothetical protein
MKSMNQLWLMRTHGLLLPLLLQSQLRIAGHKTRLMVSQL